jgi:N-acylneuraminate cytidylyltransferase/CMP-N,N'-diacetyllegionaminic acid synthase
MKVLFLIVARGGSKGIPKKNLLTIGGISLVGFKAISARKSKYCSRLIISTDSEEIQDEARRHGGDVLFTRPAALAHDTASTEEVMWHAVEYMNTHTSDRYDALMLLEPSSPFGTHEDYDKAVEMMEATDANVVLGMREVAVNSVFQGPMDAEGRVSSIVRNIMKITGVRRQDVAQEYTMNGALYLMKWDALAQHRSRYDDPEHTYGLPMKREYSLEIDEKPDYEYAQFLVDRGHIDLAYWR